MHHVNHHEGELTSGLEGPGPDQKITIFALGLTGSGQPGAGLDIVIVENIRQQPGRISPPTTTTTTTIAL